MKRLTALFVLVAVALVPGTALAKPKSKVYRGTFQYVGADGDYVTGSFGKVHLVDGKRNDKLSVHVRRLAPKARYVFRLQQAPSACNADAPAGTDVAGWKYRHGGVLKTNKKGVANGSARSKTFTASRTLSYFVGVFRATPTGAPGELVLCAELNTKKKKAKHHHPGDKPKPNPPAKPDDKPAHPEDKPKGKSDEAPRGNANGQDDDHPRGKSEEAPRGKAKGHDKDKDKPKPKS